MLLDHTECGHHHPRRAEPALEAMVLVKGPLDRVELAVLLQALNRAHGAAIGLDCEQRAR